MLSTFKKKRKKKKRKEKRKKEKKRKREKKMLNEPETNCKGSLEEKDVLRKKIDSFTIHHSDMTKTLGDIEKKIAEYYERIKLVDAIAAKNCTKKNITNNQMVSPWYRKITNQFSRKSNGTYEPKHVYDLKHGFKDSYQQHARPYAPTISTPIQSQLTKGGRRKRRRRQSRRK